MGNYITVTENVDIDVDVNIDLNWYEDEIIDYVNDNPHLIDQIHTKGINLEYVPDGSLKYIRDACQTIINKHGWMKGQKMIEDLANQ